MKEKVEAKLQRISRTSLRKGKVTFSIKKGGATLRKFKVNTH